MVKVKETHSAVSTLMGLSEAGPAGFKVGEGDARCWLCGSFLPLKPNTDTVEGPGTPASVWTPCWWIRQKFWWFSSIKSIIWNPCCSKNAQCASEFNPLTLRNSRFKCNHIVPDVCSELDSSMERRLEEMERRLKEHVDRRLDALEQKLERTLLSVLPQLALNQGSTSSSVGESAPTGPTGQTALTAAMQWDLTPRSWCGLEAFSLSFSSD